MLRYSLLLFFVLTNGITAKPLKPWDKPSNAAVQKDWVSIDDKGMASWGVEVEPPEDMDTTSFDIDPSMKIWKRVQTEPSKQYEMAEDDLDDLQHPSAADLPKAYAQNKQDTLPATDMHMQAQNGKKNQKAVEEGDDTDHPLFEYKYLAPRVMGYKAEPKVRAFYPDPEQDTDNYHADVDSGLLVVPQDPNMETKIQGRRHLKPEEDMDDIYHKDVPEPMLYKNIISEAQPAAAVDWPIMRKHTEPEEDLDAIYHN